MAEATRKLIKEKFPYGIYRFINSGAVTWYECATLIFSARGGSAVGGKYSDAEIKLVPVSRSEFPRTAKMPKYSILINTKFPPLRDWKEALHEFFEKHKPGINDG